MIELLSPEEFQYANYLHLLGFTNRIYIASKANNHRTCEYARSASDRQNEQ